MHCPILYGDHGCKNIKCYEIDKAQETDAEGDTKMWVKLNTIFQIDIRILST
jgi:hypothetical protein